MPDVIAALPEERELLARARADGGHMSGVIDHLELTDELEHAPYLEELFERPRATSDLIAVHSEEWSERMEATCPA